MEQDPAKKNRRFRRGGQQSAPQQPQQPQRQPVDQGLQYQSPFQMQQQYGGTTTGTMGTAGPTHFMADLGASFTEGASLGFIPRDTGWKWLSTLGADPGDPRNRPEYWDAVKYRIANSGLRGRTQEVLSTAVSMAGMAVPMILEALVMKRIGTMGAPAAELAKARKMRAQGQMVAAAEIEQAAMQNMNIARKVLAGVPGPKSGALAQMGVGAAHSHVLLTADTGMRELMKEISPLSHLTEEEKMHLLANPNSVIKGQQYDPATRDFGWVQADGSITHDVLDGMVAAMGHHQKSTAVLSLGGAIGQRMLGGARGVAATKMEGKLRSQFFDRQTLKGVPTETIEKQWAAITTSPGYQQKMVNELFKNKGLIAGEYLNSFALGAAATKASDPEATAADVAFGGLGFMFGHFGSKAVTGKSFPRLRMTEKEQKTVEQIFEETTRDWNEVIGKQEAEVAPDAVRQGAAEAKMPADEAQQFVSKHESVFKELGPEASQKYIDTMFKDSPGEQKLATEALKRSQGEAKEHEWTAVDRYHWREEVMKDFEGKTYMENLEGIHQKYEKGSPERREAERALDEYEVSTPEFKAREKKLIEEQKEAEASAPKLDKNAKAAIKGMHDQVVGSKDRSSGAWAKVEDAATERFGLNGGKYAAELRRAWLEEKTQEVKAKREAEAAKEEGRAELEEWMRKEAEPGPEREYKELDKDLRERVDSHIRELDSTMSATEKKQTPVERALFWLETGTGELDTISAVERYRRAVSSSGEQIDYKTARARIFSAAVKHYTKSIESSKRAARGPGTFDWKQWAKKELHGDGSGPPLASSLMRGALQEAVNLKLRQEGRPAKKQAATKRAESGKGQGSPGKPAPVRFEERKHDIDTEGRPSLDKKTITHIGYALRESVRLSEPSALRKDGKLRKDAKGWKGSDIAAFQDSMRRLSQKLLARARELGREPAPVVIDKANKEAMVVIQAPGGSSGGSAVVNTTVPKEFARQMGIGKGDKAVTFKESFPDAGRVRRLVKYFGGEGKVFVPAKLVNGKLQYAVPTDTPFLSGEGAFVSRVMRNLAEQGLGDFKDPALAGAAKKWRDGASYKSEPTKHEVEHFHERAAAAGKEIPKDAKVTKRTQIKANYKPQTKEVWYKAVTHLDAAGYGFPMEGKQRSIKLDSKQFESIAAQAGVQPRQMTLEALSTGRNIQDGRKINRLKEGLKRAKERGNEELAEKTEKQLERELKKPKSRDEAQFIGKPFEMVASAAKLENKQSLDNFVEFLSKAKVLNSKDGDLKAMMSGELSRVGQRFRDALARSGAVSNSIEKMAVRLRDTLKLVAGNPEKARAAVLDTVGKALAMRGETAESVIRKVTGEGGRMDRQIELRIFGGEPFEFSMKAGEYKATVTYDGRALTVTAHTAKGQSIVDGARLYKWAYNVADKKGLFKGEVQPLMGMQPSMLRNVLKGYEAEMKRRAYNATQGSGMGGAMEVRLTTGELVFSTSKPPLEEAKRYGSIMERVKKRAMEITMGSKSKPVRLAEVFKMSDQKGRELQEFVWKAVKEDMNLKDDALKDQVLTDMYNMVQDVSVNARGDVKVKLSPVEGHRSMKLVVEEGKAVKAELERVKERQKEKNLSGQEKALLVLERTAKESELKALRDEARLIQKLSGREEAVARAVMAALGRRATNAQVKSLTELMEAPGEKKKLSSPGSREAWEQLGLPVNSPKGRRAVSETVPRATAQAESVKSRLNRRAAANMKELPDAPLKDQLAHLYHMGPKALLEALQETAMMAGGVKLMVKGRNLVDFGISVEALERQLSVILRTKQDGTPLPKDRKNKGTLRGFMRLDPAVAERLGLDNKTKEELDAAGLKKTQGGTYTMDMDVVWGKMSKEEVSRLWREGKERIVDMAHPKHVLQDIVNLEALLRSDIEAGRFGEWTEAMTRMTVGNKAERERILRDPNATKHSAKALQAFPKQLIIMARAKQLGEAGMLHIRDWVTRDGKVHEVSMLEKLEAAMNRGAMKKLARPETTLTTGERVSLDLGRVLVEYAAGVGSKRRSLQEISKATVKEFEELARVEKEYGERLRRELNERAEHRELEPGKFIERDFSTRLRQMSGERMTEMTDLLKRIVEDPANGRETLKMLASRKAETQIAVRRRLLNAGVKQEQVEDVQTVARAYVLADALSNVANSKVVEHRLRFSPAYRAGQAEAPLADYIKAPATLDQVHDARLPWFRQVGKAPEPVLQPEGKVSPMEREYLAEHYDGGITALGHYSRFLPKHMRVMEEVYAAEFAGKPRRVRQDYLEEQIGAAHLLGDVVGSLAKTSRDLAGQILQAGEYIINTKAGRFSKNELAEVLSRELELLAGDSPQARRNIKDAFGGKLPGIKELEQHMDAREVQRAAAHVETYFTLARHLETSRVQSKDRAFWAAQRLMRANKGLGDMSKAIRRELSKSAPEHGRGPLIREKGGEWYWDYHNFADYVRRMMPEESLRLLLGKDYKGAGCTCETAQTQRRRLRRAMEENANGKVYAFYGPAAKNVWKRTEAYFDSLSGWKGKLGQRFFEFAKDTKDWLLYLREGTAKWGFDKAIEEMDPETKELRVRTAEAILKYERILRAYQEKFGDRATEKREYILFRYFDDNVKRAPDPAGTKSPYQRNLEHGLRIAEHQARIERVVSRKFPELREALDAVKEVLEVEREIARLAHASQNDKALRLLSEANLPLAGKRLSRVYVGPSQRAHLKGRGVKEGAGQTLVTSPDAMGFFKGRKDMDGTTSELKTLFDTKTGRIADKRFLGSVMPITAAHTVNSKLNDIHFAAMFKHAVKEYVIPADQATPEMLTDTRFGMQMYVRWGTEDMLGFGAKWAGRLFPAVGRRNLERVKETKAALRKMFNDPGFRGRQLDKWRRENAERAEQGKKPLKKPGRLSFTPIGGPKGEVAEMLKALESGYIPRDLAMELMDVVRSATGLNTPKDNSVEAVLRRLGGYWAQTKTVLRPKHYVNTMASMVLMNNMYGGMPLLDFLPYYQRALHDIKNESGYFKEIAHKFGGKEFVDHEGTAELLGMMTNDVGAVRGTAGGAAGAIDKVLRTFSRVEDHAGMANRWSNLYGATTRTMFRTYRNMELGGKVALYTYLREGGMPKEQAWQKAAFATVDPTTAPAFLRGLNRGDIGGATTGGVGQVKFKTWATRILPTVAETVWTKPVTMVKMAVIASLAQRGLMKAFGYDDDEMADIQAALVREKGLIAGTLEGQFFHMPLPKSSVGRFRTLNMWNFAPFQDVSGGFLQPNFQPVTTVMELATGQTMGLYSKDLRPEGTTKLEQARQSAWYAAEQFLPVVSELTTILGRKDMAFTPAKVPGVDEVGAERWLWDTSKALAVPVRTWTPSTSLGLPQAHRNLQEETRYQKARSELVGDARKRGHIIRRLSGMARNEGMAAVEKAVAKLEPQDQVYAYSQMREIALYSVKDPVVMKLMAYSGMGVNDFMNAVIEQGGWTEKEVPFLKMLAAYKADGSESFDQGLYLRFNEEMAKYATRK